ncbi:NADH-quinone oxidoreductase subunit G [bacterium]|nr:NADH-quinone oxidoreductase subunit G [bacterium]
MSEITITIDGKQVQTQEGEYILNAARANGIFIPAICYLTRCSPTLACRICLVEADGKQVYACNAKAKEGMQISTSTETIEAERRAIMEVYDVNHPLECGVCDQSGECELQNYTLEIGVDAQTYTIKDTFKPVQNWGLINYDPALCIMCERCTTVCKDMIGDSALSTKPRGGDNIDEAFKESMPKDAYAMWNKLNKSLIQPNAGDTLDCTDCGECTAVCPVGALVSADFQYTSNAWELKQVPATCSHCSAGCQIQYDVKHASIDNPEPKIYRVKNEWNYVSLCGAGRYGYDFQNEVEAKDEAAFARAVEAFEKADAISFTSQITNEEALILQKLKETKGYKLINEEARKFAEFMKSYSAISGTSTYKTPLKEVNNANFVISVGSAIKTDNPNARFAMNNSMIMNKGAGLYFHPVADPVVDDMGKNILSVNHAPMQEEAVMYLLLDLFAKKDVLPAELSAYLASFHSTKTITVTETIKEKVVEIVKEKKVNKETGEEEEVEVEKSKMVPKNVEKEVEVDENRLLEIVNAPKDFSQSMEKLLNKKDTFALMVGPDFYSHPNAANLARLVALVEKYTDFSVTMIPEKGNTLGVAMICELDAEAGSYTVGYNVKGDFTLSALGNGDLDMPAMNQQEGTLTSIQLRVNPTNAAVPYHGYELNDIANALGVKAKNTIDYTARLGQLAGFKSENFDDLPNYYTNKGEEMRGYELSITETATDGDENVTAFNEAAAMKEAMVYLANPTLQFNDFTNKAHQLHEEAALYVSSVYASANELTEGTKVSVETARGSLELNVKIDTKMGGNIPFIPNFDSNLNSEALFSGYRFSNVSIKKV